MVRSAADGSGASGAIEPLAAVGRLLPSGVTNGSGGGPSHGASTRASWPSAAQRPGQAEHLALHAARHRQAVGADEADAHRGNRTRWATTWDVRERGWPVPGGPERFGWPQPNTDP